MSIAYFFEFTTLTVSCFLRLCLDLQPISQQFILVLKKWSESNKLSEHITTYAIAILAIFYLQINGYLLSVKKIRELTPTPAPVIDGWETVNITKDAQQLMKNHVIPYEHTLPRLLKDFFAYYEHFNDVEDVSSGFRNHQFATLEENWHNSKCTNLEIRCFKSFYKFQISALRNNLQLTYLK